jgi:hypothetical protein
MQVCSIKERYELWGMRYDRYLWTNWEKVRDAFMNIVQFK